MTVVVVILSVVVVMLTVLVTGLLRSHGEILRRLHAMGAGLDPDAPATADVGLPTLRPRGDLPREGEGLGPAVDLVGAGLRDDAVNISVAGVRHRTLLAFLSSGCITCHGFWDAFARPEALSLPADVRVVVVTKDAAEESITAIRELAAPDLALVMSSAAWGAYAVPGSPYFALVDPAAGRVVGEGTGQSWEQVRNLVMHATGDEVDTIAPPGTTAGVRGAAATEARIDLELLASGIEPGDPSLYGEIDVSASDRRA